MIGNVWIIDLLITDRLSIGLNWLLILSIGNTWYLGCWTLMLDFPVYGKGRCTVQSQSVVAVCSQSYSQKLKIKIKNP